MINRSSKISRDYRIKLLKSWSCPDLNFKSYVEVSWILSRLGLVGDASTLNRCNLCGLTNLNLKNFACREISIEFRKRWKSRTFYTNNVRHNYTMHNQLWSGCWVGGGVMVVVVPFLISLGWPRGRTWCQLRRCTAAAAGHSPRHADLFMDIMLTNYSPINAKQKNLFAST